MQLTYNSIKDKLKDLFGIYPDSVVSVEFSKDSTEDLITILSFNIAERLVKAGKIENETDFKFDDFYLLANIASYCPALKQLPLEFAVVDSKPVKFKVETTGEDLIDTIVNDTCFSDALDVLNSSDLEFFMWCSICDVIQNSPVNIKALTESTSMPRADLKYRDLYTGRILLTYEGAEYLVAEAIKDFDSDWSNNVPTVVSKNRMPIARAIMQAFRDEGYEPTLSVNNRYKTHEITIPDSEWSGVRISIISHAVCNPEEQLIEIEVYE